MAKRPLKKTVTVLDRYEDTITRNGDHWRNPARADRVIQFIENLTVPSGVNSGKPMRLRDWQKKFICDIYESCDEFGKRIVSEAILSMGRKNGKTAIIAALALVHLVGPEAVPNGEIYSAANDKEQASIIYKFAKQFVEAEPELDHAQGGLCKCVDSTKRIVCHSNGSFYRALSRDMRTKHGLKPTVWIYDELAQALDRDLYDTLNTGDGASDEILGVVISTQSRDPQHILSELIDRGLSTADPSVVCHLYAVPDHIDDDLYCEPCDHQFTPVKDDSSNCPKCGGKTISAIHNEKNWYLGNPALDDFLLLKSVRKKSRQALESPSFLPSFRNLTLNQRVDLVPALISGPAWKACHDPLGVLVKGEGIYLGLDLSATTDLCALVAVSAENGSRVGAWFWKPKNLIKLHEKRDRAPYERWVQEGYLFAAPGDDIDYDLVATHLAWVASEYKILGVAYDRWRMATFLKSLARIGVDAYYGDDDPYDEGIRFVEWGQGYKDMAPAVDAMEKAVVSHTLAHAGHPVLTWCMSNAVATVDPAGNRKLDKSKARFRIDGAVALTMAEGLKARDMPDEDENLDDWINNPVSVSV